MLWETIKFHQNKMKENLNRGKTEEQKQYIVEEQQNNVYWYSKGFFSASMALAVVAFMLGKKLSA